MLRRRETTTEKKSFDLSGVPETMLQTLYARAKESCKQPHYIYDAKAIEIVEALDYDFTLADKDVLMGSGVLARTIVLDKMVGNFLQAHPGAVIVNLACGLDTRCYRTTQNYLRWYNLDLPETIAARAHFLPENGPVYQIAASAMDAAWAGVIQQTEEPVLVIIEGLTMYLTEQDVQQIFAIIQKRFAHATVFVETMSPLMVRHIKEKSIEGSKAKFSWGVRGGIELQRLVPDFRFVREVSLTEGMQVFAPIYKVLGKIGFIRNLSDKIVVLEK